MRDSIDVLSAWRMPRSLPTVLSGAQVYFASQSCYGVITTDCPWLGDATVERVSRSIGNAIAETWHDYGDAIAAAQSPREIRMKAAPGVTSDEVLRIDIERHVRTGRLENSDHRFDLGKTARYFTPFSPLSASAICCEMRPGESKRTEVSLLVWNSTHHETPAYRAAIETIGEGYACLYGRYPNVSSLNGYFEHLWLLSVTEKPSPLDWEAIDIENHGTSMAADQWCSPELTPVWFEHRHLRKHITEWRRDRTAVWPLNRQLILRLFHKLAETFGFVSFRMSGALASERIPHEPLRDDETDGEGCLDWSPQDYEGPIPPLDQDALAAWRDWARKRREAAAAPR